jgi:hypothetical protein
MRMLRKIKLNNRTRVINRISSKKKSPLVKTIATSQYLSLTASRREV